MPYQKAPQNGQPDTETARQILEALSAKPAEGEPAPTAPTIDLSNQAGLIREGANAIQAVRITTRRLYSKLGSS